MNLKQGHLAQSKINAAGLEIGFEMFGKGKTKNPKQA